MSSAVDVAIARTDTSVAQGGCKGTLQRLWSEARGALRELESVRLAAQGLPAEAPGAHSGLGVPNQGRTEADA